MSRTITLDVGSAVWISHVPPSSKSRLSRVSCCRTGLTVPPVLALLADPPVWTVIVDPSSKLIFSSFPWLCVLAIFRYWVFATTDLSRSARGIVRDYAARPECEEDHRQLKGDDWEMDEFRSTSPAEIVFHVLMVLFAYNLCQVYGQTEKGERFAGKTKRARLRQVRRERALRVLVIAAPYDAVLEHLDVSEVLLEGEGAPWERLRAVVKRLKADRARHR